MKIRNVGMNVKTVAALLIGGLSVVGPVAFAQGTTGSLSALSGVLTGLDTTDVISAMVGAATLLAAVGFAKWASKKVGKFFG